MIRCEPFEISKEVYDRAQKNRSYIASEDMGKLFTVSQLCGYGVYGARAFEKDGKYLCAYNIGSSCD